MARRIICRLIFSVFFLFFTLPVFFAEEMVSDIIRVGYYENEIFQEGAAPGAVKKGYAYEYYQKLSEYTGWKYEYVYGSFSSLYDMLCEGKIDFLAGLAKKEGREEYISYPYISMGKESYSLLKHSDAADKTKNLSYVDGKTVGVLNSAMVDVLKDFFLCHGVNANIQIFENYDELFKAFDSKKFDVLATESEGTYGRKSASLICHFGETEYYLCVNKKRPDLLSELNLAQAELRNEESNYLNSLKIKYSRATVSELAFSEKENLWLENHKELKIGYLKDYLPYSGETSGGEPSGILTDVMEKINDCLGINDGKIFYTGYENYHSMLLDVVNGTVDLVFPVGGGAYYAEENGIYQSNPLVVSSIELVCKKDFPSLSEVEGKISFAVNKNNVMQYYYVVSNFSDAEITLYDTERECLDAVLKNDVDCTTVNALRVDILKNIRYKGLSMRQLTLTDDRSFGVRIGNEGLLRLLNRGLNAIGPDYAQNLSFHYTKNLYDYTALDFLKEHAAGVVVLILLGAGFVIFFLVRDAKYSKNALNATKIADRAKMVFLDGMTHDIKNPINAIIGFTALARMNINHKERLSECLRQISISSGHLLSLINNVLDMSRIESKSVVFTEDEVNLELLFNELASIVRPDKDEKNLDIRFSVEAANKYVITDKFRLNQILLNLIDNAVKFTPAHGKVLVRVSELGITDDGEVKKSIFEFSIKDNGVGLTEDSKKVIFDPFVKTGNALAEKVQGSGLGLAITKRIVELMGGSIRVKSEEGKGSEFIVTVPLKICLYPVFQETYEEAGVDFSGKRVLFAEDAEASRMIGKEILESFGFEVELAKDGIDVLDKIKIKPEGFYDLILINPSMPGMDGYEVTRQIRSLSSKRKALVPVVAVSPDLYGESKAKGIECGMNAMLSMPYDVPKLKSSLENLLK